MTEQETSDFLVVGAGLGGIAFARDAARTGHSVRILERGRTLGGRAASLGQDEICFDYGAQYFTARGARLCALAEAGLREGWLSIWNRGFPYWQAGSVHARDAEGEPRFAPVNGMGDLPARLADGLTVQRAAYVTQVRRDGAEGVWTATCAGGSAYRGRRLILNLPPPQMLPLTRHLFDSETIARLEKVTFLPTWTLLVSLERDLPPTDWTGALEVREHPVLAWVSRDHTKRAAGSPPALVVHASGAWSAAHLEEDGEAVRDALLSALPDLLGAPLPGIRASHAHRWRFARPLCGITEPCLYLPGLGLGACGDWCFGSRAGRVEAALESGWALAQAMGFAAPPD